MSIEANQSKVVFEEAVKKHGSDTALSARDCHVFQITVCDNLVDPLVGDGSATILDAMSKESEIALDIGDAPSGNGSATNLVLAGEPETRGESHSLANSSMETKGVLLTGMGFFLAVSLNAASNPPALMVEAQRNTVADGAALGFIDVVRGSMPALFYFLVCNTTVFMATMGAITTVLCFLPCFNVTLFVVFMVLVTYILLLDNAVPRYTVEIASRSVSNSVLLWISVLSLICFGLSVAAVVNSVRHLSMSRIKSSVVKIVRR